MIYSPSTGVLFTHVSRTAGITISDCLRRELPDAKALLGQHDRLALACPILGKAFDNTFKFAMVRNPWERFVSWYALILQMRYGRQHSPEKLADPASKDWREFESFLEIWASDVFESGGVVRRRLSQWAQLSDASGSLLTDDFGKFEHAAEDCPRLFAKAGLVWNDPMVTNSSSHYHYSIYYTKTTRDLVEKTYPEDIEGFKYAFENQDHGPQRL